MCAVAGLPERYFKRSFVGGFMQILPRFQRLKTRCQCPLGEGEAKAEG
jgi:hypothetical protein